MGIFTGGGGGAVSSVFSRTGGVVAVSGDYTAAEVGALAATAAASGDLTGNYPGPTLAAAGPGATGPIGAAATIPIITIDAKGRVTALASVAASGGGGTTVGSTLASFVYCA